MATPLRISRAWRVTGMRPIGQVVRLITDRMANTAALRRWGEDEAKRVALAVVWGRYGEDDAKAELATHLAYCAEKAKIRNVSCRQLAATMFAAEMQALDERHNQVLQTMIGAAEQKLREDRRAVSQAAHAAADIARDHQVPPDLIDKAVRIALWRVRRRA